ncbi:hypothetical protein Peur_058162 [Populus x canadensis]
MDQWFLRQILHFAADCHVSWNDRDAARSNATMISWQSPIQGFIKLDLEKSSISYGPKLLPELLALKHGLLIAWNWGYKQVLCNSDSMDSLRLIKNYDIDFHRYNHHYGYSISPLKGMRSLALSYSKRRQLLCGFSCQIRC